MRLLERARPLVIGIDASTTAVKAIAWDRSGRAIAQGRSSYPLVQPHPTWFEQNAEHWWAGACKALNEVVEQVDRSVLDAICITHQRESFVPVTRAGQPLRHAILWLDERCRPQVESLRQSVGPEQFHQITGKPLTTNPSLLKILWLRQHEADLVTSAYQFLDTHAFLVHRLTGEFRTSVASADPMGLVDMDQGCWAIDLVHESGLRVDQLPELVRPGALVGTVSSGAAAATGLPAGLPVVAGAGDGQCAGLGVNALSADRASLNIGTAVVSGVFSTEYRTHRAFRTLCAPIAGQFFLETVIQSGALIVGWFVEEFAAARHGCLTIPEDLLEAAAVQVPPGSLGLIVVPYWRHAMTPYWDPAASGITIGWTRAHTRAHFYRAILEGIAFEQRLLEEGRTTVTGQSIKEYVAMGGGSRSALWCQIMANVTGIPVIRAATTEATCLGAGVIAAGAAGWYRSVAQAAKRMTGTAEQFVPDVEVRSVYNRLYTEVYRPLYPTLQPLINRLTHLTNESEPIDTF
ncbi:MAG: xylulose kinase [Chloroflexi bacterium]|nr:xylulose kinase [Chloroflexota bacterium]